MKIVKFEQRKKPMNDVSKRILENPDLDLLKRTVCKNSTDDELTLFIHICRNTGLDPFMKQIYAIKRGTSMTYQTSIDGFRLIADRSGNYSPGKEPTYCYDDKGKLVSATAYVKKRTQDGVWHEVSSSAYLMEYNPNNGSRFWTQMPHVMLAKCAEANALRKAFPAELSGLYTSDEMEQADSTTVIEVAKETLSESQIVEILDLIGDDTERLKRMLTRYGKEKIEEIEASQFDFIKQILQKK